MWGENKGSGERPRDRKLSRLLDEENFVPVVGEGETNIKEILMESLGP